MCQGGGEPVWLREAELPPVGIPALPDCNL
jgi:hypothetical protein